MIEAPDSPKKKRPLFLVAALATAFALGTGGWVGGCESIAYYHADPSALEVDRTLRDETERPRLDAALDRLFATRDAARRHAQPLGIASFVLGAAILSLAARGLGGRPGARSALVQVVSVQAALAAVTFVANREIRWADREVILVRAMGNPPRPFASPAEKRQQERVTRVFLEVLDPAILATRTAVALLVVFALTRPRARELLEPAGAEE